MEIHNTVTKCHLRKFTVKKNQKKLDIVSSPSWIWPENFINIAGNVVISKTPWKETSWMTNPFIAATSIWSQASSMAWMRGTSAWRRRSIYLPPPCREKLFYRVEEWRDGGRYRTVKCGCCWNQFWTRAERWKDTLSQTTMYCIWSIWFAAVMLCNWSKNVSMSAVL